MDPQPFLELAFLLQFINVAEVAVKSLHLDDGIVAQASSTAADSEAKMAQFSTIFLAASTALAEVSSADIFSMLHPVGDIGILCRFGLVRLAFFALPSCSVKLLDLYRGVEAGGKFGYTVLPRIIAAFFQTSNRQQTPALMAHLHLFEDLPLSSSEVQDIAPDELLIVLRVLPDVLADVFEAIEVVADVAEEGLDSNSIEDVEGVVASFVEIFELSGSQLFWRSIHGGF